MDKVIVDWNNVVLLPSEKNSVLVLSKINAPFLFGDIIDNMQYDSDEEEQLSPEIKCLNAIGILHKRVCDLS